MKHSRFSHMGRSWSYLDLPKQSWYYFWFSSSVFQAPEDFHLLVSPCASEVCHFLACFLPCSMVIWIPGGFFTFFFFFLSRNAFGNLIYNTLFQSCPSWIFLYLILSLYFKELHYLCSSLPSRKTAISQMSFFSYGDKGAQWLLPSTTLQKSLHLIIKQLQSRVEIDWCLIKTVLCQDVVIAVHIPCDWSKVTYWFPFWFRQVFISIGCL